MRQISINWEKVVRCIPPLTRSYVVLHMFVLYATSSGVECRPHNQAGSDYSDGERCNGIETGFLRW